MNKYNSTKVIEKLIDLELLFKLKADLSRFKKKQEKQSGNRPSQAA
ncbi:hypothetical protein ACFSJU_00190 [Paradesertivirga mongoliensis]|uniref:Transposase n=1 Tax=Paradesertivirga mongoliensis TaxID=2100740 RepID=A0ABW4ZGS4_9SPHI|nr:hypothetical protein [Pedobacter mongoliensis]